MGDTSATNPRGIARLAGPLFVLAMLVGSLLLLQRELDKYHLQDFLDGLQQIPARRVWLALGLTVLNYLILIFYDVLGVRYIGHSLQLVRVALASFLGYAIGNNFGTLFGGATIRYRLYSSWGLSAVDVMKLVLILGVTFWIGLFALASVLFLVHPLQIPPRLGLFLTNTRPLGAILAVPALGYLAICAGWRGVLRIGRWEFYPPPVGLSILQYIVATIDILVAAAVPYLLLPNSVQTDFPHFVCIYVLAIIAGLMSQVPGGLGVLELVIVVLLDPSEPQGVISAMLAYRVIYYLLPLALGLILLTSHELSLHGKHAARALSVFGRWSPTIAPTVLALCIFISGSLLLFSSTTPASATRMALLGNVLPLWAIETSHLLGSIAGVLLILLARGIQRRIRTAYAVTCALLPVGIATSIVKGFDIEEAVILSLVLLALIPSRSIFFRQGSLLTERFTPRWLVAIACVLLCSLWLMYFSYKNSHTAYTHELWWQISLDGFVSRSMRALLAAVFTGAMVVSVRLLKPPVRLPDMPTAQDLEHAHNIADNSTHTASHLALLGDKHLLFNSERTAFVMYGMANNSYIAMGDPIGSPEAVQELAWELAELSDLSGHWPAFYQVGEEHVSTYVDMGMSLIKIGEEARVDLAAFDLSHPFRDRHRQLREKLSALGCELAIVEPPHVAAILPRLREISDLWLVGKQQQEKGFSLGYFDESYFASCPVAVVRHHGVIIGFADLWLGAGKEELSIDLVRCDPGTDQPTMEFLFIELILWGKQHGYRWFNLGLAPLAATESSPDDPLWQEIAALTFQHSEHFSNYQDVREFKSRFSPQWSSKYLASPAGIALSAVLDNVAELIAGRKSPPRRITP
ncbi:MAG: bifunctional lysylphosphatidylglycerol flippase/synthetase MprF [Planctomycetota bacterium]|nr:bifunctional lysylphosphatidylglycerol flippase/synthetase MprF [Planctomycetota bacterium]MDA1177451.1 bifunctional lysylphosphatidylglycerol flippase/synthetase MprF [Planctomycetota bacterium]